MALGYETIVFLRAQDHITQKQRNEIMDKLLEIENPEKFWNFILDKHYGKGPMGYLEAKFPAFVPAEYFESIEVPKEYYDKVISWPEAQPFRDIIKIKVGK